MDRQKKEHMRLVRNWRLRAQNRGWRFFAWLLVSLLCWGLVGCQTASSDLEPALPLISDAEFPRLDGSTATIPLGKAVYQYFTGATAEMAAREIVFYKTDYAYSNLDNRRADLLLVYEGGAEVMAEVAQNYSFEKQEIGLDALVFLTSEENPVDDLSLRDIQKIYSGEYTNWSQVGGLDLPIVAYQRNEESGSQALMRKLVMSEVAMADPERIPLLGDMGQLIEAVAEYQNGAEALGYSVYYYAANMYAVEHVKLLAVEGVTPSPQTIADGSYLLTNPFFAIIRADEAADSPARQIYDFLGSAEGKSLIEAAGYVSAP